VKFEGDSLTIAPATSKLWQLLDSQSLQEFLQAEVVCLRLDLLDQAAPGNKRFKLNGFLAKARSQGLRRLVSFGGAWSNHLHALASVGHSQGFETVGLVRGELDQVLNPMLQDVRDLGMQLIPVSREEYRRKDEPEFLEAIAAAYGPCLIVPEGGADPVGVEGCLALAELVQSGPFKTGPVVLGVGTGTTLAGLVAGLEGRREIIGVSALKGAYDLEHRVRALLARCRFPDRGCWRIEHDYHCGGFARVDADLKSFILAFEAAGGPPLEPVYTGKALFALYKMLRNGAQSASDPITFIHTGGLQGRRGYPWLVSPADGDEPS
jgi:1-aminocyclopropane-1-carboxylate deaminase